MENLFLYKNKDPKLEVFRTHRKQPVKDFIPINSLRDGWQADLMFLDSYARYNSNYGILLVLIEIPTRYGVVYPLKKKSDTFEKFKDFIKEYRPNLIITDKGGEFVNNKIKDLFKENNVKLYDTKYKNQVGIVERFNRTLRNLIERYIQLKGSYNYVDALPEILKQYNNHIHRTTGYSPNYLKNNVNKQDEFIKKQNQKIHKVRNEIEKYFKPGMKIRKLINKALFEKGATPKYSSEVYEIIKVEPPWIYLNDDSKVYYKNLILTSGKTLEKPIKTRKSLNYDKKIIQKNKREAVDVKNIIETKRTVKKNSKYSY